MPFDDDDQAFGLEPHTPTTAAGSGAFVPVSATTGAVAGAARRGSAPVAIPSRSPAASSAMSGSLPSYSVPSYAGRSPSSNSFLGTSPISSPSVQRLRNAHSASGNRPARTSSPRGDGIHMKTATRTTRPRFDSSETASSKELESSIVRTIAASTRLSSAPPIPPAPVLVTCPTSKEASVILLPPLSPKTRPVPPPVKVPPPFEVQVRDIETRLGYLGPIYRHKVVAALEMVYNADTTERYERAMKLALLAVDMHMDGAVVIAAALRDAHLTKDQFNTVVDDTARQIIEENARCSEALHLANLTASADSDAKLRKLVISMATDWRAIALELFAVRLDWEGFTQASHRNDLANQILCVYAPLANQLGMWFVQSELEELAFEHLHPSECEELRNQVGQRLENSAAAIENAKLVIERALCLDADLRRFVKSVCIRGRIKGIYSLYKKMQRSGKKIEEIWDLIGLRIRITPRYDNIDDREQLENRCCYKMLDLVHSQWQPFPERVKDFVEDPKENGYSSLHTTVDTASGVPLEIQIRTESMHARAEFGRAAHWAYKDASYDDKPSTSYTPRDEFSLKGADSFDLMMPEKKEDHTLDQEMSLFKSHADFMEFQSREIRKNHVLVLSQQGDIHELIPGSNVLDLAFNGLGMTHSDVVRSCSPTVNGVTVPLTHPLSTGDVVDFDSFDGNARP